MKRSGFLQRKTPLRSTSSLKRSEPMKRSRLHKAAPRRVKARAHMRPYVRFVKTLACFSCNRRGPSDPAHMTLGPNEKGMSLKVNDRQCVPLCRECHNYFDGNADGPLNPFRGFSKGERWAIAAGWVKTMELITNPETLDQAYDFANLGLGEVFHEAGGKWTWKPITDEGATP